MHQTVVAPPLIKVLSNHGFAEVRQNIQTKQKSLYALRAFLKGESLSEFSAGKLCDTPNYLTVQTGRNRHITLIPEFLQYINHGCEPNVFFDTTAMQLTALRDLSVNEELLFFYPSTEWDMAQPFFCYCESKNCLQNIKGAKYLRSEHLSKYTLTDFIMQELKLTNP
ncbi:MAG: SET domain-containing protein-lysine N-methyltransferase [Ferruginibacter sp.]